MSTSNIFILGATGYIGGSVLERFLKRSDASSLNITALVRSPEKATKLATFGINAVVGSHTDADLVEKLASEADVVISMANSDYTPAMQAILRGLEKRYKATGVSPHFIHTSGTAVIADNAMGAHSSETVFDDSNADQINTTLLQRWADVELDAVHAKGHVKTYIIIPSTIYGVVSNDFVKLGIQNPRSIQVPKLVDVAIDRGQGGTVGAGKNLWNNVHIDDAADLYLVLYDSIKTNPAGTGHGREGYYFVENGTHSWYDVGKVISEALVGAGRGMSPEPTPFTQSELEKYFGLAFAGIGFGSNARVVANRSRAIGWRPKHTTEGFLPAVKADVDVALKAKN